nr:tyrosine-protein phosphatase non-receptor type substrate 1-like isoform X2 [Aotus nancymaae]
MATTPGWALRSLLPTLLLGFTAGQPFISLTGPSQRTTPGDSVPFNCTAGPFNSQHFSRDFHVTWLKDSDEHPASAQRLVPDNEGNDFITSKAWVTLARQDVSSEITCKVTHRALAQPLQTTMKLSQVLRVVPTLKITTEHSGTSIRAQDRVNLTCHVRHFYPRHLQLTWMQNRRMIQTLVSPQATRNPDGTYSLEHMWQAEVTPDEHEFACWVVHDEQPPLKTNITLQAQEHRQGKVPPAVTVSQSSTSSSLVAVTCLVQRFYPQNVHLTWLEDCRRLKGTEQPTSKKNDDGSYTLENVLLVNASEQGLERVLTCIVEHEGQLPKRANLILSTAAHTTCKLIGSTGPEMPAVILVVFLLGLKVLLVMSFTVTYICRRWNL